MKIEIPGNPIAQQRARSSYGRFYDPLSETKKKLKNLIAPQATNNELINSLIQIEFIFYIAFTKSSSKAFMRDNFHKHCDKRPDIDNFIKFYLDLMNNFVYTDDSLVGKIIAQKIYSSEPKTIILINPIGETMATEHVICYKKSLSAEDVEYIARKANQLGYHGRDIYRVYTIKEKDENHLYFETDEPGKKKSP